MNLPAKVFVIVNLVLGVIFATLSVSLYAKKVNYAKEAESAIASHNSVKAQLDSAVKKANDADKELEIVKNDFENKLNRADTTIKDLQASSATQQRNNEELKSAVGQAGVALNGIREDLKGMLKEKTALEGRIESLSAELKKANTDRMLAQRQSVEISANMKNIDDQFLAVRKQNADLQGRLIASNNALKEYQKRFGGLETVAGPPETVRGEVFKVFEESDLVIIRLGSDDSVREGMEMMISRGDEYVSKVTVSRVDKDQCSALIIKELTVNAIRVGDIAETL